jgi:hypothetical protein
MNFLGIDSTGAFTETVKTLYDYGAVAIGLLLLLLAVYLYRQLSKTRDKSDKVLLHRLVGSLVAVSVVLFVAGGGLHIWVVATGGPKSACLPLDSRLNNVAIDVSVAADATDTFVNPLPPVGALQRFRIVGVNRDEDVRFTVTNRLDYFSPDNRVDSRSEELRERTPSNQSAFTLRQADLGGTCRTRRVVYEEELDVVLLTNADGVIPIHPDYRSDAPASGDLLNRLSGLGPADKRGAGLLIRTALAADKVRPGDYERRLAALLDSVEKHGGYVQRVVASEIAGDYPKYAPFIAKTVKRGNLTPLQDFTLVVAIRAYLQDLLKTDTDLPELAPETEDWLLFLAGIGERATRMNARAILRSNPTRQTVARFAETATRIDSYADGAEQRFGERVRLSYALTGLDVLYNYAVNTSDQVRKSDDMDPAARRDDLQSALAALDTAWQQHTGVDEKYYIDFTKALYGKGIVWMAVADQFATGRLQPGLTLNDVAGLTAASAIEKASRTFAEFDDTAQPADMRKYYLHPHHFDVVKACPPAKVPATPDGIAGFFTCVDANAPHAEQAAVKKTKAQAVKN